MPDRMSDLGEKGFLAALLPSLATDPAFVNGFGHDASIIDVGLHDALLAINVDRVPRPIAAERGWASYRMWGHLGVTVACSDLIAVGATPRALMMSIVVPGEWLASDVQDIVFGCQDECISRGVTYAGGDTKEGTSPQLVTCAVGIVSPSEHIGRVGVEAGCVAILAGTVGGFLGSYFQLLKHEGTDDVQAANWVRYLAEPEAQWGLAGAISPALGIVASMDLSDGLYEAIRVLTPDRLGFELDLTKLPFHQAALDCSRVLDIPLTNLAFGVGDWGILLAVRQDSATAVMAALSGRGVQLSMIGKFDQSGQLVAFDGRSRYPIREFRNESFRSRMEDETEYMRKASSERIVVTESPG